MVQPQGELLDQILLEDIARYCPQPFLNFHQCMSKPQSESENCEKEQAQLAKCIKSGVPSFQRIQGVCAETFSHYDQCLRKSNSDTSKCTFELKKLRECASESIDVK